MYQPFVMFGTRIWAKGSKNQHLYADFQWDKKKYFIYL